MPIESRPYYYAVCDVCECNITEGGGSDYSAWGDYGDAATEVQGRGGRVFTAAGREVVLCDDCTSRFRSGLGDDAWDAFGDDDPDVLQEALEWADVERHRLASADPWVCHLCGQPLPKGERCNSGYHQGPSDLNGFRGERVRLSASKFDKITEPYTEGRA